jgi:hypothetical protein
MKIVVCSLYINDWYRDIVKYGKISLEKYCQKHGYDFVYETESSPNAVYDGTRDIPWFKVKLILKLLQNKEYDFIVWNDADSVITNDKIKLEDKITKYLGDKDVLVAKDWMSTLNTGTMFIRNTQFSKDILQETWNNKEDFPADLHEQASLGDIYTRNVLKSQEHIVVLPNCLQNEFLTYWHSFNPSCFIVHATRCSHDRTGFVFTMDMFCPVKMEEETVRQYNSRLLWMCDNEKIQEDIQHYLSGGQRRNLTARYIKMIM